MTRDTDTTETDGPERDRQDGTRGPHRRAVLAGAGALAGAGVVGQLTRGFGVTEAAESVEFDGIEHRALGDAELSTESGALVASGIDEEGDDGVAAQTVQSTTWGADISTTTSEMGVGSTLAVDALVNEEGEAGVVGGTSSATVETETRAAVTGSYSSSSDAGDVVVEARRDQELVATYEPPDPERYVIRLTWEEYQRLRFAILFYDISVQMRSAPVSPSDSNDSVTIACVFEYATGGPLDEVEMGDRLVEANRVRIVETVADEYDDVWYATEMQLRGAGMDSIVIDGETVQPGLVFDGHPNRPAGDASLSRTDDALTVEGVDGNDGVEIVAGSASTVVANFDPVGFAGGGLQTAGRGTVDGVAHQSIGSAGIRDESGTSLLSADFDALDAEAVVVEVYDGLDLVGSDVVSAGTVAGLSGDPRLAMAGARAGSPTGYTLTFDRTTTVQLSSGVGFDGNRVRLLADSPRATVADVGALSLLGAGLGDFDITAESSTA